MAQPAKYYELPKLPYGYGDLAPYISEQQLSIHHDKHHRTYVKGANEILEKLEKARKEGIEVDIRALLKALSFNIGGHVLHSTFWENLAPPGKGGGKPGGTIADVIEKEFGSFDRFKKEFTQTASSVEGSGWGALAFCRMTQRPMLMQIEKHNANVYPMFRILLIVDVFEHAYYIDYKNERAKFIDAFWNIVDWNAVDKRLGEVLK